MRYNNTRRKAAKDTPAQVQARVLSSIITYLQRHGCTYITDGNSALTISRPNGGESKLSFRAYYGNEEAAYVLVEIVIDGRRTVSGERSSTQRLFNHSHSLVNEWAASIGVSS
ncbi:hypothetical protein SEA_ARAXXI_25 [Microbacterium phage Araxxi]|uniref:Uncharacterized protein n=1 Tax=Microbacterium phage Araxxi TaxID=2590948 RepID=A0A516KT30_9CAUD|nr:hypothetical protein HWC57_gp25 [Microbacterium phage Araxxi]QDP44844.1 hypothetical protein SEA_ARAXXI_25 [Microbacterium phage Araxxi]USH45472.1 hypothetical protein SEA_DOTI_25 [Microbacterium phage DoTi]